LLDWRDRLPGEPLNGTVFGAACPSAIAGGSWIRTETESEDCLFLNVFTPPEHVLRHNSLPPEARAKARLPVIAFAHGA
jgi:carboxylesterase type B